MAQHIMFFYILCYFIGFICYSNITKCCLYHFSSYKTRNNMTKLKFLILPTQSTLAIYYFLLSHFNIPPYIFLLLLSNPLLLRISPNTFAFIPIPPMSLSSLNRSNSKAFRHILPRVAPVCEGMHYHKTRVPWQMNNTLIINFSYHKKPRNAVFWSILPTCFFFSLLVN